MLGAAIAQAWSPFVLVGALLIIGAVAHGDGLFSDLGDRLERLPGPPAVLFVAGCALLVLTTAVLNLDTAVVFVTPVIVLAAGSRGIDRRPFLYAALFVVNAASLYLPGSNLTNLLVLAHHPVRGSFAAGMFLPGLAATVVTVLGVGLLHRRALVAGAEASAPRDRMSRRGAVGVDPSRSAPAHPPRPAAHLKGLGAAGAIGAAALMVIFTDPALEVLLWAAAVAGVAWRTGRVRAGELIAAASPQVLAAVFTLAVGLGVLARAWSGPAHLLAHADRPLTAILGAVATVFVNNLPAAVMLSAHTVPHPRALLIGLNIGPNLAITGSLAAFLWLRTAAQLGERPSVVRVTQLGIVLVPAAIAAALLSSGG